MLAGDMPFHWTKLHYISPFSYCQKKLLLNNSGDLGFYFLITFNKTGVCCSQFYTDPSFVHVIGLLEVCWCEHSLKKHFSLR